MRIYLLVITLIFSSVVLSGCTVRQGITPTTDPVLQQDYDYCHEDATSMSDPPYNSNNAFWQVRFERCMRNLGYTPEQLKRMWY